MMYTISQYGNMYTNKARIRAYATALRDVVMPNSLVLDIGAGTGIFALLACRFGARRVYAVEPTDAIDLAREIAAANGCSDRITFIRNVSSNVTLPERVDVIISDLGGRLPLFGQHIPAIVDARSRLLAPGGTLIAQRDYLRAAIIEAPGQYEKLSRPWSKNVLGVDLSAGWRLVANTWVPLADKNAKLLTRPSDIAVLDYPTIANSNINGELVRTIDEPGTAHGAVVWFDRTVADGIKISNEPNAPEAVNASDIYGQAFFPWPNPIDLEPGDEVSFCLKANLVNSEYVWRWDTTIRTGQKLKAHFRQSSLLGQLLSLESLKKREAAWVPAPNEDARIDAFVLSKIDGNASLGEVAHALAANFSSRFSDWQDALSRVGDVAARYEGL